MAHHCSPGGPGPQSCRKAKARHAANTCAQLEAALGAYDHRAAWEHCRLLAGHSSLSQTSGSSSWESFGSSSACGLRITRRKSLARRLPRHRPPRPGVHRSVITLQTFLLFANRRSRLRMESDDDMVGSRRAPQVPPGPGGSAFTLSANSSIHALVLYLNVSHTAR